VEANSTGGQGSREAVAPSGDDDDDDDDLYRVLNTTASSGVFIPFRTSLHVHTPHVKIRLMITEHPVLHNWRSLITYSLLRAEGVSP
jgi:hypothetical protein